jgi:hypothetical protein
MAESAIIATHLLSDDEARAALNVSEEVLRALLADEPTDCVRPYRIVAGSTERKTRRWYPDLARLFGWLGEIEKWRGSKRPKTDTESAGGKAAGAQDPR